MALLAACYACSSAGAAEPASPPIGASSPFPAGASISRHSRRDSADFRGEAASRDTRNVADWVIASGDNNSLPFMIVDKVDAKVFLFDGRGEMRGAAAALLGLGRGDHSVAGIGQRRLATISPEERITPAGRFIAALGHDLEQDVLWIDYNAALSLHRVIVGGQKDRRFERLASPSPLDNGISYGCINVPVAFYNEIVSPAFKGTVGIVYILPESKSIREVFAIPDAVFEAGPDAGPARRDKVWERSYFLEDSRRTAAR